MSLRKGFVVLHTRLTMNMKNLESIVKNTNERLNTFNPVGLMPALRYANEGAIEDVLNINGCANYQWSTCLIDVLKPKQVVELGGAMGVWSLCVLHTLPESSKLYSITLPEGGLEFSYVQDTYPNFYPIHGDDLNMDNWPKGMNWNDTDIIYFDSLHTPEHLQKEVDLYVPLLKERTIMLFDDIHSFGLEPIWDALPYEKIDLTDPCHYTGWGAAIK